MAVIYVDADACPVKQEIYRVAKRYGLPVVMVSNAILSVPSEEWIKLVVVAGRLDAADDWIADHVTDADIVITGDIPLAARCLDKGAAVLDLRGGLFTESRIGESLASREILRQLRDSGVIGRGPTPFQSADRSRFLQRLDQTIVEVQRRSRQTPAGKRVRGS